MNTDAYILVNSWTGFNMYAEYTQLQLTFLALVITLYDYRDDDYMDDI